MTTTTTTTPTTAPGKLHPFERAGLGKAPFRFAGYSREVYQAIPGDPSCPLQPGACCDYCGQGIMDVCKVKSADGKTFKVGNDCVRRVYDECAGTDLERELRALWDKAREPQRKRERARRAAKADAVKAELEALIAARAEDLAARPHPRAGTEAWAKGRTLADYVAHMMRCCGAAGRARLLAELKAALA